MGLFAVQNGAEELIIATTSKDGIYCYRTTTKSLKWRVAGKLPGMQKVLYPVHITTDGRGHLFVSDGVNGNRCIQMFSVSDGQYMGCLTKEGEQGLGHPNTICWHSASHSLAVVLLMDCFWSLSVINMEY